MERDILRNEKGIAFVVSLIMLLVLTLIGFSSVNTTTFEANITWNERIGIEAFNAAEAGDQEGVAKIPVTSAIPVTNIGQGSYWSGRPADKSAPAPIALLGLYRKPGYDVIWAFNRYQVHVTGESMGATREVESQVSLGPFPADTTYNN